MYPKLPFEIFGFSISTFGIMMALGFFVAGHVYATALERSGYTRDQAWSILMGAILGGLLGAKLWFVAESAVRVPEQSVLTFLLNRGGLTWYGGLVGGLFGTLWGARSAGVPLLAAAQLAAPAVALGQAIGRIGCFLVGDDYGQPTALPWGVEFPDGAPPTPPGVAVHPTMLYESAWLFAVAGLLWLRRERSPCLLAEYFMLAGIGRFANEMLRTNPPLIGPLSNAQLTAVVSFLAGIGLWAYFRERSPAPAEAQS